MFNSNGGQLLVRTSSTAGGSIISEHALGTRESIAICLIGGEGVKDTRLALLGFGSKQIVSGAFGRCQPTRPFQPAVKRRRLAYDFSLPTNARVKQRLEKNMKAALGSDPRLNADGLVDRFKDQLLIVLLKRLGGGPLRIPIDEMDRTGLDLASFRLVGDDFVVSLLERH